MSGKNKIRYVDFKKGFSGQPSKVTNSEQKKAYHRHIRKLAADLHRLLPANDSRDLVSLIGAGSERNNLEALVTWAHKHLSGLDTPNPVKQIQLLLPLLRKDLEHALNQLQG